MVGSGSQRNMEGLSTLRIVYRFDGARGRPRVVLRTGWPFFKSNTEARNHMTAFGKIGVTCYLTLGTALTAQAQSEDPVRSPSTDATAAVPAAASPVSANEDLSPAVRKSEIDSAPTQREYSRYRFNSAQGSTGLVHLFAADSGAPGTFRLSFLTSYYAGDGFLCPNRQACSAPPPSVSDAQDVARRNSADLSLSITPASYLELTLGTHSHAFSDNFNSPSVIQALGDTYGALKLFSPRGPDQIFSVGGLGQLRLLNSAGTIGINTANVSFAGLATADFSNRSNVKQRVPVRIHANLGYLFDNSSNIASDVEKTRQHPISRIERFGFGINRLDSVFMGLGIEYVGTYLQPFTEWTIDVAANRQGYVCQKRNLSPGDTCMEYASGISTTPSRWTIGTHLTPHFYGLNAMLALDIATSGSSTFVEERSPEIPWSLYLGIGYAVDTVPATVPKPPPSPPQIVQLAPPPEHHVLGTVVDEDSGKPISHAQIDFDGRDRTGLISRPDGTFDSGNLEPGEYKFKVQADGYKEGACSAIIEPEVKDVNNAKPAEPTPPVKKTELKCSLKPAPALGVIEGTLVDSETNGPIARAMIRVRDERNRALELQSNDSGTFRAENVPAGQVHLSIAAEGYLPSDTVLEVKKQVEQHAALVVRKIPKKASVTLSAKEVKLSKPVLFVGNTADISPESQPLVQELAAVLLQHPELISVELQGHTDDAGTPVFNRRLSQERAESVRAALMALGIEGNRLTANGLGSDKPLVPNTSDANRAKNRRVQFIIVNKSKSNL